LYANGVSLGSVYEPIALLQNSSDLIKITYKSTT
jgi:hypothetical protein